MALRTEVRVGAFVAAGLLVMALTVFLIGETHRMFDSKSTYYGKFADVEGLNAGAQVLMGGVNIGHVVSVRYPADEKATQVVVELAIVYDEAQRIRQDSVVRVAPKGMLGDKQVVIERGSIELPHLPAGSVIPSSQEQGLFAKFESLGEKADAVLGNLEKTSGALAEEEFRHDVQGTVRAARSVLQALDEGQGYVPRLLHDADEAARLSKAVENLERSTAQLNQVLSRVDRVVARINQGPGFAHDVVYGSEGTEAVKRIGDAAEQVALTLEGIRQGDGLAKNLLFGGPDDTNTERAMEDVAAITSDLRVVVRQLREGKGTLGALMVDPSVYEDLKVLLGNVQRNDVLRALVRYSIARDEKQGGPVVQDPTPSADAELSVKP